MAEYIKRETVLERAEYDNNYRLIIPVEAIKAIPAADVAPVVHGRWLYGDYYDIGDVCSECDWDSQMTYPSYRYCPNCGARMDEVE